NASDRQGLRAFLKEKGVETRPLFPPANTMPHVFSDQHFPVASTLSERGINLPSFPALTTQQITYICDLIRSYFDN
ncbi:DegT/DnrJ/EryC1/StrS family aminotransferase, partial [Shigella sonnei]